MSSEPHPLSHLVNPDPAGFEKDPFGYATLARYKWGMAQLVAGFEFDPTKPATDVELKSPILWLAHAHALQQAATRLLLKDPPDWSEMPEAVRGVCDCQYHATALMLVGYSLEVCLKGMIILTKGFASYVEEEKKHHHHRLVDLADFIPDLDERAKAVLRGLTHFVMWAGRYPDPGKGKLGSLEEVFSLSETHQVSANLLFNVAARIIRHVGEVVEARTES